MLESWRKKVFHLLHLELYFYFHKMKKQIFTYNIKKKFKQ